MPRYLIVNLVLSIAAALTFTVVPSVALESVVDEAWAAPCGNPASAACLKQLSVHDNIEERRAYAFSLMTSATITFANGGVGCISERDYVKFYSLDPDSLSMTHCRRLSSVERVRIKDCESTFKICRFLDLSTLSDFWTAIHNVQPTN